MANLKFKFKLSSAGSYNVVMYDTSWGTNFTIKVGTTEGGDDVYSGLFSSVSGLSAGVDYFYEVTSGTPYAVQALPNLQAILDFGSYAYYEFRVGTNAFNFTVPLAAGPNTERFDRTFSGCSAFNQDISGWDTSNVTYMNSMFRDCSAFNQNIGGWNTSKVTDMGVMFRNCPAFNKDIGGWDTSKVTSMTSMFNGCSAFNQDISGWDTSNVTSMNSVFRDCRAFNQDIGGWNTSKVTDMGLMFNGCWAFNKDIGGWDTSKVTSMTSMFNGCSAFNQDLRYWDVNAPRFSTTEPSNFSTGASAWEAGKKPLWGQPPLMRETVLPTEGEGAPVLVGDKVIGVITVDPRTDGVLYNGQPLPAGSVLRNTDGGQKFIAGGTSSTDFTAIEVAPKSEWDWDSSAEAAWEVLQNK
jgi:surface protein